MDYYIMVVTSVTDMVMFMATASGVGVTKAPFVNFSVS